MRRAALLLIALVAGCSKDAEPVPAPDTSDTSQVPDTVQNPEVAVQDDVTSSDVEDVADHPPEVRVPSSLDRPDQPLLRPPAGGLPPELRPPHLQRR